MSSRVLISTEGDLAVFRQQLSGSATLARLAAVGVVDASDGTTNRHEFVQTPPGTGKSTAIDEVSVTAVRSGAYDLVVILSPTRDVVAERKVVHTPPNGIRVQVLRARPSEACGTSADRLWKDYERRGLGATGRAQICGACPHSATCPWPTQLGAALQGAQLVVCTSAYLANDPFFLSRLKTWTRANRMLVLVDEDDVAMTPFRRVISREHLQQHIRVLEHLLATSPRSVRRNSEDLEQLRMLINASTEDLREGDWDIRGGVQTWAAEAQTAGVQLFGTTFRFIADIIRQLKTSRPDTREKLSNGDLSFASIPAIRSVDAVIYSGTASSKILALRLGVPFSTPFNGYFFQHAGTTWYNLASSLGSARNFQRNAPQILDAIARLTASRMLIGKRVAVVSKKRFAQFCRHELEQRLRALGIEDAVVVTAADYRPENATKNTIVLLTYGLVGCNTFSDFDCCYCLNSFNVSERVLDSALQDLLADDYHIPLRITISGHPRRRTASVLRPTDRFFDLAQLAQEALDQKESGVVLQAVGRVRPFTQPREILTMQCAQLPGVEYTREFSCLAELRNAFSLPTRLTADRDARSQSVAKCREAGNTQVETAAITDLSLRTVKRHWNHRHDH